MHLFIQETFISFDQLSWCAVHLFCHSFAYSQPLIADASNPLGFSLGAWAETPEQSSTVPKAELVNKYSGFLSSQIGYL